MTTLSIGYCSQPTVTQHLNRQNKWSQSWTSRKVNVVDAVIECEDEKSLKGYASCVALGVWTRAAPASTPSLPSPPPSDGIKMSLWRGLVGTRACVEITTNTKPGAGSSTKDGRTFCVAESCPSPRLMTSLHRVDEDASMTYGHIQPETL